MAVTKYVITNNLTVLYNTREAAFERGAFKRLFHSKITIKTSQCRSIA